MNWAQTFYHKQALWGGLYQGEVTAWHRAKAARVKHWLGAPPKQVLELGAGGGQDAIALAEQGYAVVALEREPLLVAHIRRLLRAHPSVSVQVVEGDFYEVDFPPQAFDAVCYWDGFGIGRDADQHRLLKRISRWLKPDGMALIDVYTPWHAAKSAWHGQQIGEAWRVYAFDAQQHRWIDTWTFQGETIAQSLRCYTPAELQTLLVGTGLTLVEVYPGGMMDYEAGRFIPEAPLEEAMWYTALLRPRDFSTG